MSEPQPLAKDLDRWPESWYIPANKDLPKRLTCIARGCDHIFETSTDIRYRWNHWQNSSTSKREMTTDHGILRALNAQRNCPSCDYTFNSNHGPGIRDLFQHEMDVHGTNNTTSIEGIVTLVREGRFRNVTPELQQLVFERMCQILKTTFEYRVMLNYCNLPPYTIGENFKTLLSPERLRPRGPLDPIPPWYIPIPAHDFLMYLAPNPFDLRAFQLDWETNWNNLREMYAKGII